VEEEDGGDGGLVVENDLRKVAAAMRGTQVGWSPEMGLLQLWRRTKISLSLRLEARCPRCSDRTYGSSELEVMWLGHR
jgi:hypothetical protein